MIIGLTGKMGSGKSTALEILKKLSNNPKGVELVKFAQPLYDIQEYVYYRIEDVYKRPHDFIKDRKLLQWLGTEWGRNTISQDLWIDLWASKVEALKGVNAVTMIVCDDCRFDNEAQIIHAMGGHVVLIQSDLTDKRIDTKSGISNHTSEAGVSPNLVDYTIRNNGTLAEFENNLFHMLNMIKNKQGL
jgi:energy-coupling factor transporter ATP-binding protein EcfA2